MTIEANKAEGSWQELSELGDYVFGIGTAAPIEYCEDKDVHRFEVNTSEHRARLAKFKDTFLD